MLAPSHPSSHLPLSSLIPALTYPHPHTCFNSRRLCSPKLPGFFHFNSPVHLVICSHYIYVREGVFEQRNCIFAVRISFPQLENFLGLICIQFKFSMCTPACFVSKLFIRMPWKASCRLCSEHMLVVVVRVTCSVHYQKLCLLSPECQLCCTRARHPPFECRTSLSCWQRPSLHDKWRRSEL